MVKSMLILFLCISSALATAQANRYDTIRYAREHYAQRVTSFEREAMQKGCVVFLGDSHIEFGDWQKLLGTPTILNRGVAGDNTFGALDRLDEVIARSPSKLFLAVGINDISQNIPESSIVKNIIAIVHRVKTGSPETMIYVYSILPTNDHVKENYPDAFGKNAIVKSVNRQVQSIAKENGFIYLDLAKILSTPQGKLDQQYAESDGLHLNIKGYHIWAEFLKTGKFFP